MFSNTVYFHPESWGIQSDERIFQTGGSTTNYSLPRPRWFMIHPHLWWFHHVADTTVDGRNPAPPGMMTIPFFMGVQPSQVVQDFIHQQYHRFSLCWGIAYLGFLAQKWTRRWQRNPILRALSRKDKGVVHQEVTSQRGGLLFVKIGIEILWMQTRDDDDYYILLLHIIIASIIYDDDVC